MEGTGLGWVRYNKLLINEREWVGLVELGWVEYNKLFINVREWVGLS